MFTHTKIQTAANYTEVRDYLRRGVPFRHRSISAHYDKQDTYTVLSYSTVVATWAADGTKWVSPDKYSRTTSKQQTYIRQAWSA